MFNSEEADVLNTKQSVSISRVVFKAPPFWEDDPELWFYKIESQFIMDAISSELPVNLQQILSVFKAQLDEIAEIAEKIHEVSSGNLTIANIESKCPDLNALLAEVSELKEMVREAFRPRRRSGSGSASQSEPITPSALEITIKISAGIIIGLEIEQKDT
ncbi:hypothetical protein NPIL_211641 [Nephila pilipes]|uniref:Uncharacterized protein n=1 Tax=Nephila pilipes TaxID=299642 RepID=A0A8X6ITW5_NEPPI|nr:hypothetical protein NPIL_211641 [Nephila pilipes]